MWGAASLLLDGRVLVCGGVGADGYVYLKKKLLSGIC
jgi:hypothetical protein